MSTESILMMLVAMAVIWGGLALAVTNLARRSPEEPGPGTSHRDL